MGEEVRGDDDTPQQMGREQPGAGRRWAAEGVRAASPGSQLTFVVAPKSLILGLLGVEVFELSEVPDSVPK